MAKKRRGGTMGGGGMPGGVSGGMGANLMAQMRKMQEEMEKVQTALGDEQITGTAGGGMVTAVVNGHQELLSLIIKPEVVDPDDVEMLQDLVLAAVNDAMEKSKALAEERMSGLTGGLGLPPGLGF
jgi:nucleoid-associated protein EbfC